MFDRNYPKENIPNLPPYMPEFPNIKIYKELFGAIIDVTEQQMQ